MQSADGPRTKRRKYVKRACKVCVAAKRSCSDGRPCERCVRLGKTLECIDDGSLDMDESSYAYRDNTSSQPPLAYDQYQMQTGQNQTMLHQRDLQLQQIQQQQQHYRNQFLQHQQHQQQQGSLELSTSASFTNGTMMPINQHYAWPAISRGSPEQMMHSSSTTYSSAPSLHSAHSSRQGVSHQLSSPLLVESTRTSSGTTGAGVKGRDKSSKKKPRQVAAGEGGTGRSASDHQKAAVEEEEEDANHHSESDESIRRAKGLSKRPRSFSNVGGDEGRLDEDDSNQSFEASSAAAMTTNTTQSSTMLSFNSHGGAIQPPLNLFAKHQQHLIQNGVQIQPQGGGTSPMLLLQKSPYYPPQMSTSPHLRVAAQGIMDSPTLLGQSSPSLLAFPNGEHHMMIKQQQQQQQMGRKSNNGGGGLIMSSDLHQQLQHQLLHQGTSGSARIINVDEINRGLGDLAPHHRDTDDEQQSSEARRAKGLSRRSRAMSDASGLNDDDDIQGGETGDEEDDNGEHLVGKNSHSVDVSTERIAVLPHSGLIAGRSNPFTSPNNDHHEQQQHYPHNMHSSSFSSSSQLKSSQNPLSQSLLKHSPHNASFGFSPLWQESTSITGAPLSTTIQQQAQLHGVTYSDISHVPRSGPSDFVLDGEKAINVHPTGDGQSLLDPSLLNAKAAAQIGSSSSSSLSSSSSSSVLFSTAATKLSDKDMRKHEGVHFETTALSSHDGHSSSQQKVGGVGGGGGGGGGVNRKSSLKGRGKDLLALTAQQAADFEISLSHLLNFEDLTEDALATPSSRSECSSVSGEIGRATKKAVAAVFSNTDDININNLIVANVGGGGGGGGIEGGGKQRVTGGKGVGGKGGKEFGGKGVSSSLPSSAATTTSSATGLQADDKKTSVPSAALLSAARVADQEAIAQLQSKLASLQGIVTHLASEVVNLTGKLVKAKWGKAQAERELVLAATILHSQFVKEEEKKKKDGGVKTEAEGQAEPSTSLPLTIAAAPPVSVASFTSHPGPKSLLPRVLSSQHLSEASC